MKKTDKKPKKELKEKKKTEMMIKFCPRCGSTKIENYGGESVLLRCADCKLNMSSFPETSSKELKIIQKNIKNNLNKKEQEAPIDFLGIEKKWQSEWEKAQIFKSVDGKGKKCYVLEMYPYPSASFLHVGHVRNFTIGDVYARYKRMNGFNVLYPMGYDSFGLPAETASKKEGIHPRIYAENAIKKIMEYQKASGNSYDWSRIIASHEPEYYKWNQFFFLKLFENGLAYRKKAPVNYCENCQSVLANEEAESGKCWRCGKEVIQKETEQWFFKITKYADQLLEDLEKIDWSDKIKTMQRNWIGKSQGSEVIFEVNGQNWPIFTTRPDTIYGVTFMVISALHPKLLEITTKEQKKAVETFIKKCQKAKTPKEIEGLDKEGVFTGAYAINPITKDKVPVWAGNFVLADYGSGMVMAVPCHDQRDFEFANKYKIPMKQVIAPLFNHTFEKDAYRSDKKTEERESVSVILKHWKEDKYFCLDWKKAKWKSFILGGIDKGETFEETIKREVKEESGYSDIKSIKKLGFEQHSRFYAEHKDINRYGKYIPFIVELKSGKYEAPSTEELERHEGFWIDKDKVLNFINMDNHKYVWDMYINGERAYTEHGILINSDKFNGLESKKAIEEITKYLEKQKLGKKTTNYKIRDWMISRQRYWGTPIPIIYCEKCGIVPVPYDQLPVLLPEKVDFKVSGNPLSYNKDFINTECPRCNGKAKRETDTLGGFMDSSWYFLRYCDNKNREKPFDSKKVDYWLPVDQYIGGIEQAVGHLMYARFLTKFLKDIKMLNFDEPFTKLFNQGIVYKDGYKMSKSHGNVVFQTDISEKYGIDTARLFLMFVSSPDKQMEWTSEGVEGSFRIINRLIRLKEKIKNETKPIQENKIHSTIKKVSENIENFEYPKAIISMTDCLDSLSESISKQNYEILLKLFHPFCPHITEELWHDLGNKTFISLEKWPKVDNSKINENLEKQEQAIEKTIQDINNIIKIMKEKKQAPKKVYLYTIPNELNTYKDNLPKLQKSINIPISLFAVNDKNKFDPQNKAGKAKPGKPAIYLE